MSAKKTKKAKRVKRPAKRPAKEPRGERTVITGNYAVAYAAKLARVEVVSAYPITPQTSIVEKISEMCASGEMAAQFIKVESEHSAMACLVGASSAGVRSFTATSSHGLAYMHEMLHWAAGARLPIVLANVNRALGPGWNIWTDQTDSISQRDTGWLQFYPESAQETLDTILQAFRVAEAVLMPAIVVLDAFFLSHTFEPVEIPPQALVDKFLPRYEAKYKLDTSDPRFFSGLVQPDVYMEMRHKMDRAAREALDLAKKAGREFGRLFGRSYDVVERYRTRGAETLLLATATIASTAKVVVDELRARGVRIGLVRPRLLRPFPAKDIAAAVRGAKRVAVIDRSVSFGAGGAWAAETRAALYNLPRAARPVVHSFIAGLGGRDVTPAVLREIAGRARAAKAPLESVWIGVKP